LTFSENAITQVNLSNTPELTTLIAAENPLTSIDLSGSSKLSYLNLDDTMYLTELDVSNNPLLHTAIVSSNLLTDISSFEGLLNLIYLDVSHNNLDLYSPSIQTSISILQELLKDDTFIFEPQRVQNIPCDICDKHPCECDVKFNVNFNPNSGEFRDFPYPQVHFRVEDESQLGIPPAVKRDGSRFIGWFDAPIGGTRYFENTLIKEEVNLYARWHANPSGFMLGSTSGENRVTSADATRIARWLVEFHYFRILLDETSPPELFAADINGDGVICLADLILFARWLVGHNVQVADS
jgi:hypothetical protein